MGSLLSISEQSARKLLFTAIAVEVCLVAVFLGDCLLGEPATISYGQYNLDGERNVPALFSSAQLFLVGIVFFSVAYESRQRRFPSPLFLAILGAGFIFLSFDEAFTLHEKVTRILKHTEWIPRFKGNHGIWIAPYLIVGLAFFLITYKDFLGIWNNYRREATIMAAGIAVFLVGVVGLEIISYQFLRDGPSSWYLYQLEVAIEEFLEMIGISIALYGAILLRQTLQTETRNSSIT